MACQYHYRTVADVFGLHRSQETDLCGVEGGWRECAVQGKYYKIKCFVLGVNDPSWAKFLIATNTWLLSHIKSRKGTFLTLSVRQRLSDYAQFTSTNIYSLTSLTLQSPPQTSRYSHRLPQVAPDRRLKPRMI